MGRIHGFEAYAAIWLFSFYCFYSSVRLQLSNASFPSHWDPLPFLERHSVIQCSNDLDRFKADLKHELVQAHFASVQSSGSMLSKSQAVWMAESLDPSLFSSSFLFSLFSFLFPSPYILMSTITGLSRSHFRIENMRGCAIRRTC